tara:strand:+ start:96 stop:1985 length:1890 start_codon:yes stop_codon:yes gene_type:complete
MESIQITGNKARFDNYLTSPLVVPENAKVCLNKASFSIPVWTQKYIDIPNLDAADRAKTMFTVYLNGIETTITWTEFYNGYNAINNVETVTEPAFYNGNHKFYLNNRLQLVNTATGVTETIPSFSETLAQALSTKFEFYDFRANNIVENNKFVDVVGGDILNIANVDYTVNPTEIDTKNFGVIANYAPEKISAKTPVTMDQYWAGADFQRLGDNITLQGVASSYAIAKDTLGNSWAIDPNGGYWNFRVDMNTQPSELICGVILTSEESKPDITTPTAITADSIQIGIKFSFDGNAHFQALDGTEVVEVGGAITYDEVLYPRDKVFTFDNDTDEWFIQIRRAAGYETGAGKFVFRLLHGDINNQGFANAECFYQSEFTLPSPDILAVPIIFSSHTGGGAGANEVKDNFIIDVGNDSLDMGRESLIFSDGSFQLVADTDSGAIVTANDFFNAIGLHQNDDDSRWKTSYDASNLSNSIAWSPGTVKKSYFVGVDEITKIFDNNINHLRLSNKGSGELPRQIEVSLSNLAHTPHVGSFAGDVLYTEPDINKVVSYVNTDSEYFDVEQNTYLEYVYEAFNLVGRRLKNRAKLNLNQFAVNLGYKNFLTNQEEVIDAIRGVVKLEFLFDVVEGDY